MCLLLTANLSALHDGADAVFCGNCRLKTHRSRNNVRIAQIFSSLRLYESSNRAMEIGLKMTLPLV